MDEPFAALDALTRGRLQEVAAGSGRVVAELPVGLAREPDTDVGALWSPPEFARLRGCGFLPRATASCWRRNRSPHWYANCSAAHRIPIPPPAPPADVVSPRPATRLVQSMTAVASTSTRCSGTSRDATPRSEAGGTGTVPSFAAARAIPSISRGILSGVQSTT